ncbi:MAG: c-type cytochrome [Acidobacteriota bacterium]
MIRTAAAAIAGASLLLIGGIVTAAVYLRTTGLNARDTPGALETRMARAARRLAIPRLARDLKNPVPESAAAIADGMAHFADHCASCHGNDGSGQTALGRGLYPKAPDMRRPDTQKLSDGELFYIVDNGIRFTGMPAFGIGTAAGAESTWRLVQFIRRLPGLTADELERMEGLNPRSPDEIRQEIDEQQFLQGGGESSPASPPQH